MEIYKHNLEAYEKVKELFKTENRCCVVHPTGTGKSYIALQLIQDNINASILYITSYSANLMHFKEAVEENLKYVPKLCLRLYARLEPDELQKFDYIILDEFHRAGATEWQKAVMQLLDDNPTAKILGLSATPVRYLDGSRNMAQELFNNRIVSEITLRDALLQKLLPMPSYISCVYSFEKEIQKAEKRLFGKHIRQNDELAGDLLEKAKRMLQNGNGLDEVFQSKINPKGKYLVFCSNFEHLKQMMEESEKWFAWLGDNVHRYVLYSEDSDNTPYLEFLKDGSATLRLLFCINMLNEGVHVKGIDGVILLRPTESPNIYFQQIGRALSVGTTDHPQIFDIVNNAAILEPVKTFWNGVIGDFQSDGKDFSSIFDVWEKDTEIIDLLNQVYTLTRKQLPWEEVYALCREYYLEHGDLLMPSGYTYGGMNLYLWLYRQRLRHKPGSPYPLTEKETMMLEAINIDWDMEFHPYTWEESFEMAKEYFEQHGNLRVPPNYKCENGYSLGVWIRSQRVSKRNAETGKKSRRILSEEEIESLESIGMIWAKEKDSGSWEESFARAELFYKTNVHLRVPKSYCCEDGYGLGKWISLQRRRKNQSGNQAKKPLSSEQIARLESIGMVWTANEKETPWDTAFLMAEEYYKQNGNLEVPVNYVCTNGFKLGTWVSKQAGMLHNPREKLSQEQIEKLESIGINWRERRKTWMEQYQYAKDYYNKNGNLNVPVSYICEDGFKLGNWLKTQRIKKNQPENKKLPPLTEKQITLLDDIGMVWVFKRRSWDEVYQIAERYYKKYGNLNIPSSYRCEDGFTLGQWISDQRKRKKGASNNHSALSQEQIDKLNQIGMVWKYEHKTWDECYAIVEQYYKEHGHLPDKRTVKVDDWSLNKWLTEQRRRRKGTSKVSLTEEQIVKLDKLNFSWN